MSVGQPIQEKLNNSVTRSIAVLGPKCRAVLKTAKTGQAKVGTIRGLDACYRIKN